MSLLPLRHSTFYENCSPSSLADVAANPQLLPILLEIAGTFASTQGAVTVTGWFAWLKQLPVELHTILPDGTRVLAVRASPGRDDGEGISPEMSDAHIEASLQGCDADLVCVGHTHRPLNRRIGRWHVVNLGSVSNPPTAERRASYVLLEATETGYTLEHRLVDYDRTAVIKAVKELEHPGAAFICKHLGDSEHV